MNDPRLKRLTITVPESVAADLKALRQQLREDGFLLSEAAIVRQAIRIHTKRTLKNAPSAPSSRNQGTPAMRRIEQQAKRRAAQLAFKFDIDGKLEA